MHNDVQEMKVNELTTRRPINSNIQPIRMSDVKIEMSTIKTLKLDVPVHRYRRRLIAKEYKVEWKVYQALRTEVRRRMALRLDPVTGKSIQGTDNPQDNRK